MTDNPNSRSVQRRLAIQRGESQPTFTGDSLVPDQKPSVRDIDDIYEEEELTDEQAAAIERMLAANAVNPLPRGKRIPRRLVDKIAKEQFDATRQQDDQALRGS